MSFPRYPKYKPSGVEWLGDVPEHWHVMALKRFSTLQRGHDLTDAERTEGSYPVVTSGGVSGTHGSFMARGPGVVTGRYGSTGRLFYIEDDFWPHNTSLYVSDFHDNVPRFVWYSLQTVDFASHSGKAAVPGIDRNDIHVLPATVPPKDEQSAIVSFLDRETAKIDGLVGEQRRLIELLKEKRQAVISHAVTKGLNPHAPLKPSGIEWLGDVPEHWEVMAIRKAAKLESGHTPSRSHPEYWENCTVPWFTLADVWQIRATGAEHIFETKEKVSELGLANSSARLLPKNTVMLSRTASVGFSAIMGVDMATSQDFADWICGPRLQPEFLLYVFRSMEEEFRRLMMGSTHNTIYMPDIQSFHFALPPKAEQSKIVEYVRRESRRIDDLSAEAERGIALLQERRTALISAAVTGKIDVRGLVATEAA